MARRGGWLAMALAFGVSGCANPLVTTDARGTGLDPADFTAAGTSRREIVVKFEGQPPEGVRIARKLPGIGAVVLEVPAGVGAEEYVRRFSGRAGVAYAEVVRQQLRPQPLNPGPALDWEPNDPKFDKQYWLHAIKAPAAWNISRGDRKVIVAVVDGGVDMKHPDLKNQLVATYNVTTRKDRLAANEHGTHCAGIIGAEANNAEGGAGIAPGCGLMAVQVYDESGRSTDPLIAEGIIWAVDHGAKVVSMSFGDYSRSQVLEDALQYALKQDVVLVAAAGNDALEIGLSKNPAIPACYPGVIKVAAIDAQQRKAKFSNFGDITLAAPGVDIVSTVPGVLGGFRYQKMSGTSMAAPMVAGLAGLVRSRYPHLTQDQVRRHLERTAQDLGQPGNDTTFGHGLVDAAAALSHVPQ